MILLSILVIVLIIFLAIIVNNINEKYCGKFDINNCPKNRCKIGGSCSICADIGCHSKANIKNVLFYHI